MKTSENHTLENLIVFLRFKGLEKGCIGNKLIKQSFNKNVNAVNVLKKTANENSSWNAH